MIKFSFHSFINRIINRATPFVLVLTFGFSIFVCNALSTDGQHKKLVYQLNIQDEITPGMARKVNKADRKSVV